MVARIIVARTDLSRFDITQSGQNRDAARSSALLLLALESAPNGVEFQHVALHVLGKSIKQRRLMLHEPADERRIIDDSRKFGKMRQTDRRERRQSGFFILRKSSRQNPDRRSLRPDLSLT